jgi:hypothetical protein
MNEEHEDEEHEDEEFEAFDAQQRRLGELIAEAGKALNLEKPELVKAVVDWLYVNGDVDYFKEAVEKDEDDLPNLEAAIKAWFEYNTRQPGGSRKLTVADAWPSLFRSRIRAPGRRNENRQPCQTVRQTRCRPRRNGDRPAALWSPPDLTASAEC